MNAAQQYDWVIEYVPETDDIIGDHFLMTGTREEAEKEAGRRHPLYTCDRIVFNRRGEVKARYADTCRMSGPCGFEGVGFEPKEGV